MQKRLRRRGEQVCRHHRIELIETVKITALILPLSSTTLFEKIRGENNFSKYAQHTRSSPNTSVRAVDTYSPTGFYNFQSKFKKKKSLVVLESLYSTLFKRHFKYFTETNKNL